MEQPIDSESVAWVDRQVAAAIRPQVQHEPDTALGLIRLRRLSGQRRLQSRRRSWAAVIFVALVTLVVALPPARVYAVQCVDACIAGGRFVLEKLRPNEQKLSISHKERRQAPDFELPDSKGTPVQLSAYRGQVVVLNFWATWCNPCRLVIPWFVEFQRAYDAKGFSVIGVSVDEDGWTPVLPYVTKQKINYPIVLGKNDVLQAYGGLESLPTTLIIDRQGRVAATHVGLVSRSVFERDIKAALSEPE